MLSVCVLSHNEYETNEITTAPNSTARHDRTLVLLVSVVFLLLGVGFVGLVCLVCVVCVLSECA